MVTDDVTKMDNDDDAQSTPPQPMFARHQFQFFNFVKKLRHERPAQSADKDAGEPLYLTPLITNGQIDLAKKLSHVTNLDGIAIDGYSGYLTVNEPYGSNLFFWYFKSESDKDAPLILWLQGGPGSSALYGVFVEHGPFSIHENEKLASRPHRWNKHFNVLYIDNPVGTGFSFTNDEDGLAKDGHQAANDLLNALQQFFKLFPEYKKNVFFIAGESYGGKWGLLLAERIVSQVSEINHDCHKINLQGIIIGSGFLDIAQLEGHGKALYSLALIDEEERDYFTEHERLYKSLMLEGEYSKAFSIYSALIGDTVGESYFKKCTGFEYTNSVLEWTNYPAVKYYENFISKNSTRKALHVGNRSFAGNTNSKVVSKLKDAIQSAIPILTDLLNRGMRIMYYHGQMDLTMLYENNHQVIMSVPWNKTDQFQKTKRVIWKKKGPDGNTEEILGYVKTCDNFWEVLVRNAGHAAVADKPEAVYEIVCRFISHTGFSK